MAKNHYMNFYGKYIKRVLDFIFSLLLLVLALPLILIAYMAIKISSDGPGFFIQTRIGKDAKKFKIYKLRTMVTRTYDKNGEKIRDRDRTTKVGNIIRKLSVDELPQLFNIVIGNMSFIGPRPLLVRYLPYYTNEEMKRHSVLPGVTGLAQINGRSFLDWEERFAYDIEYAKSISFILDVKILLKTIKKVISGDGTSTIRPKEMVDFDEHRNFKKLR